MARQNNLNEGRERKNGDSKRDAASHELRYNAPMRDQPDHQQRGRSTRAVSMNRNYLNDLYERSSI